MFQCKHDLDYPCPYCLQEEVKWLQDKIDVLEAKQTCHGCKTTADNMRSLCDKCYSEGRNSLDILPARL